MASATHCTSYPAWLLPGRLQEIAGRAQVPAVARRLSRHSQPGPSAAAAAAAADVSRGRVQTLPVLYQAPFPACVSMQSKTSSRRLVHCAPRSSGHSAGHLAGHSAGHSANHCQARSIHLPVSAAVGCRPRVNAHPWPSGPHVVPSVPHPSLYFPGAMAAASAPVHAPYVHDHAHGCAMRPIALPAAVTWVPSYLSVCVSFLALYSAMPLSVANYALCAVVGPLSSAMCPLLWVVASFLCLTSVPRHWNSPLRFPLVRLV